MAWHPHVFPNPSGCGTISDGAVAAMRLRTVRRALAVEIVFLHHALETLSLRAADHIHEISRLKLRDAQIHFAFRQIGFQTKFAHESLRFDIRLLEVA